MRLWMERAGSNGHVITRLAETVVPDESPIAGLFACDPGMDTVIAIRHDGGETTYRRFI